MNVEELYSLYTNHIHNVIKPSMMADLADRSQDINGFNLLNRVLIYIQNKYTKTVRSDSSWEIIGRKVKDKCRPIYIVESYSNVEIVDAETGEVVENPGLTPDEINRAIKYGILLKNETESGLKVNVVYNIVDTEVFDSESYKRFNKNNKSNVKISSLFEIVQGELGIKIEKVSGESFYNMDTNCLYVGDDSYDNKVFAIAESIFFNSGIAEFTEEILSLQKYEDSLIGNIVGMCRDFFIDSILSYCSRDYEINSKTYSVLNEIDISEDFIEAFMALAGFVYDSIEAIIDKIRPQGVKIDDIKVRKAAELLNILEATEAKINVGG